jgi:flagella basal body P-ring formation protein FlgA
MPGTRVAVEVGRLDPRLKLAPCVQVQPYLPPNVKLWGAARIGLRCLSGPVRWNVYLPVKVSVHARGLVAAGPLSAGAPVTSADLREADIDLADGPGTAILDAADAIGRTVARPIAAGAALRSGDLKPRQWFAAGETVKIVAAGAGYAVSGEGQAMSPGLDGQAVRVRTESGRIVTGVAVADRQVALPL